MCSYVSREVRECAPWVRRSVGGAWLRNESLVLRVLRECDPQASVALGAGTSELIRHLLQYHVHRYRKTQRAKGNDDKRAVKYSRSRLCSRQLEKECHVAFERFRFVILFAATNVLDFARQKRQLDLGYQTSGLSEQFQIEAPAERGTDLPFAGLAMDRRGVW